VKLTNTLTKLVPIYAALCLTVISSNKLAAEQPFRILLPTGTSPHPVVLFVPGCSGFAANNGNNQYEERAAELRAGGNAVVFVDYVSRRMQTNCAHISLEEVATDILDAATWVRDQPATDASQISVIGWSYGGGGVLAALKTMPPDPPIARAVMYYPLCRGAVSWTAAVSGLMLLGEKDDVAYPALCDPVVKNMPADRFRVITYPNARHGFDMRGLPEHNPSPGTPAYNADAAKASWAAVVNFLNAP
jgi:dienelactone hydrolase